MTRSLGRGLTLGKCAFAGTLLLLAVASGGPVGAGQNADAVIVFGVKGGDLVEMGNVFEIPETARVEDGTVELELAVEDWLTMRGVDVFLGYNFRGLTFVDWRRAPEMQKAFEVLDAETPGLLHVVMAVQEPRTVENASTITLGWARFEVEQGGPPSVQVEYVEFLDENFDIDKWGIKPELPEHGHEHDQPSLSEEGRTRRLSDGLWWSLAAPNPFDKYTRIRFGARDSTWVSISVLDESGHVVRPLVDYNYRGRFSTIWTGKDFGGNDVEHGDYRVVIEAGGLKDEQVVHFVEQLEE